MNVVELIHFMAFLLISGAIFRLIELKFGNKPGVLGQLAEGQVVQLKVGAFPSQPFDGTIKAIKPTLDTKSRTCPAALASTPAIDCR